MTNSSSVGVFPFYKKAPVNEVVCGLRFATPDKLRIPHIGPLWDKFRTDYPNIQHAQPVVSIGELPPIDATTGFPIPRFWFINKSDDQLVQFQFDRFYFNWRRRKDDYPRYPHVIQQFESVLNKIDTFFEEQGFGEVNPTEYELTYINHIPKGSGWESIEDLSNGSIFRDFVWDPKSERFLPHPLNVTWTQEFPLPQMLGRLIVALKQAIRMDDKVPLLVLELTARGTDGLEDKKSYRKWFDTAHEWIVRGFTDLTTPELHKIWEREK